MTSVATQASAQAAPTTAARPAKLRAEGVPLGALASPMQS